MNRQARMSFMCAWKLQDLALEDAIAPKYDMLYHSTRFSDYMYKSFARTVAKHLQKNGAVLELGCGTATVTKLLQQLRPDLHFCCMDFSAKMLKYAGSFERVRADLEGLPYRARCFDAVMVHSVLHHFPELTGIFAEVRRVLKPGGRLFIQEPNENAAKKVFLLKAMAFAARRLGFRRYPEVSDSEHGQPSEHHGLLGIGKVVDSLLKSRYSIVEAKPVFYSSAYFRDFDSRLLHGAGRLLDDLFIRSYGGGYMFRVVARI